MINRVQLLGRAAVVTDGRLELPARKTTALLAYLAYQADWVSRSELLYLFWADSTERKAQTNLRQLLHVTRTLPYAAGLDIGKDKVRWQVSSDLADFRQACAEKAWEQVVTLYQGTLLEGFYTPDVPEFDEWLTLERNYCEQQWQQAAWQLSQELLATSRQQEAANLLARLHASSLDENYLRAYLQTLSALDQADLARTVFEGFRQKLHEEFQQEPEAASWQLLENLGNSQAVAVMEKPPQAKTSLPRSLTSFVGRQQEKALLHECFAEERLISLVGPGGIGKTRLALEFAQKLDPQVTAVFVPLEAIHPGQALEVPIAQALGFRFFGDASPREQLFAYLADQKLLLILDNFEHLLDSTGFVTELLQASQQLKVLVTTRERLGLQAEWVMYLQGLSYPENLLTDSGSYDAVELFLQREKRLGSASQLDQEAVMRICQWVDGMPLALELLASWAAVLPSRDILKALEQGEPLLQSDAADLPERQRSIDAIIEASWERLDRAEQQVFRCLQVFRGGFSFAAARAVTKAQSSLLKSLVDKSLLYVSEPGRFNLHPLIARFLRAQQFAELPQIEQLHAEYYLSRFDSAGSDSSNEVMQTDYDNVRLAWLWAVQHAPARVKGQLTYQLFQYHLSTVRMVDMLEWLGAALQAQVEDLPLLGQLYLYQANMLHISGHDIADILVVAEKARSLIDPEVQPKEYLELLDRLAALHDNLGQYQHARGFAEEAVHLAKQLKHKRLSHMLMTLGHNEDSLGNFVAARAYYAEAMALQEQAQNYAEMCYAQLNTAHAWYLEGDYAEALRCCQAGLALCDQTQNLHARRYIELTLIRIWFEQGAFEKAEALAGRLYNSKELHFGKTMMSDVIIELAKLATQHQDYPRAQAYFGQAIGMAWKLREVRLTLEYLCYYARLLKAEGNIEAAWRIAGFISQHPQATWARRRQAKRLLESFTDFSPEATPDKLTLAEIMESSDTYLYGAKRA